MWYHVTVCKSTECAVEMVGSEFFCSAVTFLFPLFQIWHFLVVFFPPILGQALRNGDCYWNVTSNYLYECFFTLYCLLLLLLSFCWHKCIVFFPFFAKIHSRLLIWYIYTWVYCITKKAIKYYGWNIFCKGAKKVSSATSIHNANVYKRIPLPMIM